MTIEENLPPESDHAIDPAPSSTGNSDHLVVLIHGFNTFATWMDEVKDALETRGFAAEATGYGYFGFLRFLSFPACRTLAVKRVLSDIEFAVIKYQNEHDGRRPKKISVIAHSFGSWVLIKILEENPRLKFYRIIFCGSILRDDYNLRKLYEIGQFEKILNQIGTKDYWPAIGESAGWGYGSIGSRGLLSPVADNRWYEGFRHSDFLTSRFCKANWIPFLEGNKPASAGNPKELPLWIKAVIFVPLRWIILSIAIGVVFLLLTRLDLNSIHVSVIIEINHFIESILTRTKQPEVNLPDACIKSKLEALRDLRDIASEQSVRCEGGGPLGRGDSKDGVVVLTAPPGYVIAGDAKPQIINESRGSSDALIYTTDESGRPIRASAGIHCASPNQPFGPGAWMHLRLSASIEHLITPDEREKIEKGCRG